MNHLQKNKRKLAELTLIFGVPIFTSAKEHSRLAGLQRKLQKVVLPDLAMLGEVTDIEVHAIDNQIEAWVKDIGWWHNSAHIGTLISFCLTMLEESPITYNPKIRETLNLIADHLEKGKELYYSSFIEATEITNTWKAIYTKENQ